MSDRYAHLTDNQRRAIVTHDGSILVSAAAGSGKTTVLAERCAALVCDGTHDQRCGIDELLVVTFTDAAAGEMKSRIASAIRKRIEASAARSRRDPWLAQQLYLLDGASISTIHAFCRTVIQRWFPQAGIDPQAAVLAGPEAQLLREETLDALFTELYAGSDALGLAFQQLIDDYAAGNDYTIAQTVLHLHDYISSLPAPDAWLQQALDRVDPGSPHSLIHDLDAIQHARLTAELRLQVDFTKEAAATIRRCWPVAQMHAHSLDEFLERIEAWLSVLESRTTKSWAAVASDICTADLKWTTRRPGKLSDEDKAAYDAAKDARDRVTDIFKRRVQQGCANFTTDEYREGLERVAPYTRTLVELVRQFEQRYRQAKDAQAAVDFNDLQRYTLRVLADEHGHPTDAARHLQRQYRHVLVDEFQDVDPLQESILRLVSRESADPPQGNLFTVGDIKQSIYRFRLAEPMLFSNRADQFAGSSVRIARQGAADLHPHGADVSPSVRPITGTAQAEACGSLGFAGQLIHLRENFRSREGIIDAVNLIFHPLMSRAFGGSEYDHDAQLAAAATFASSAGPAFDRPAVELHLLERITQQTVAHDNDEDAAEPSNECSPQEELAGIEREAYLIGTRIQDWMGQSTGSTRWSVSGRPATPDGPPQARPIEYRDIVILLRSLPHKAAPIADILRRMGIPARVDRDQGGLEGTEFNDVISLLQVLDNQQQDIPLAAVLRSPVLGDPLSETQLLDIRLHDREMPFHQTVVDYAAKGADIDLRERLSDAVGRLERYRRRIRQAPVAEVLWEIYNETDYLAYVCGLPDGTRRRQNLIRLHELARQFGQFSRQGLHRFLRFIEDACERESLSLGPTTAGPEENVVRIMTIHASKGLEFPVVILADLQKAFNLTDTRSTVLLDRTQGVALRAADPERRILYPTLIHQLAAEEGTRESLSEELRVLYVALTRAREHLMLVGRTKLEKVETHRALHGSSDCPRRIPPLQLLTATCVLDWLLPALTTMPQEAVQWPGQRERARPPLFDVHAFDRATTDAWHVPPPAPAQRAEALAAIARLQPLPGQEPLQPPADSADAPNSILAALSGHYPALELTTVPARLSVSELKRRWDPHHDPLERAADSSGRPIIYDQPQSLLDSTPDAAGRGTATHRFLQLLDFRAAPHLDTLQTQLADMTTAGRFTPAEADSVLLDAVEWFLQTDLGQRIRASAAHLSREVPFVSRAEPSSFDPMLTSCDPRDVILIRGVVDVVLDAGQSLEILDYKTDAVEGDDCRRRADLYRPQIDSYAAAIETVYRRPVTHRWLVFLHGRSIIDSGVPAAGPAPV